jgi:hypothetical protein
MKSSDTFESRVQSAMKARGIDGAAELAKRLSKRLQQDIDRNTVCGWIKAPGSEIRADILHALADEFDYSSRWLALGEGSPQRWVAVDEATKELMDIFTLLSDAAKAELTSYAYRLLRISGKHSPATPHTPPPRKK